MPSICFINHSKRLVSAITIYLPNASAWAVALTLALTAVATGAAETQRPKGSYPLPSEGNMIGQFYTVMATEEQTLLDIAREHNVGYQEIRDANEEVSLWLPGEGTEVVIPARHILPPVPREGIVINLAELRLYYYPPVPEGETPWVETYPIGIGREGYSTPLGITTTTIKLKDPAWYPPRSMRREAAEQGKKIPGVVPPGPDNPLGKHAILLDIPGYLLLGTNQPDGIGMRISRGCIRLYPEDIESLFTRIPSGTPVNLVDIPTKVGWSNDKFYAQSFRSLADQEADLNDIVATFEDLQKAQKGKALDVDYALLREAMESSSGKIITLVPSAQDITPASQLPRPPRNFFNEIALSS